MPADIAFVGVVGGARRHNYQAGSFTDHFRAIRSIYRNQCSTSGELVRFKQWWISVSWQQQLFV
jgi:hypothetical protein